MNKNEGAWRILFDEYSILDKINSENHFVIFSEQINKYRESRLMTKFDHLANLPEIFRRNNLSILPITRGSYIIGRFEAYSIQNFNKDIKVEEFDFPANIESLSPTNIFSESAAINCAYVSGMIREIVGEEVVPTISGKMSTSKFEFNIQSKIHNYSQKILVENSQCEIDGGFEGPSTVVLVEAKNAISEDFIVRQLYYPYRLWKEKVSKEVIPVFLCYSNDVFHFFIYKFEDIRNYNSIKLVGQRNFAFSPGRIEIEDIQKLLENVSRVAEPREPFPQADKFERIVDLMTLLGNENLSASMITENYDFDPRQTSYYTSAGRYLGLINGSGESFSLSQVGAGIMRLSHKSKFLALAKTILSHEVFNKVFHIYLENGVRPSKSIVVEEMKSCTLWNVASESTYQRRSQTILAWLDWILSLQSR